MQTAAQGQARSSPHHLSAPHHTSLWLFVWVLGVFVFVFACEEIAHGWDPSLLCYFWLMLEDHFHACLKFEGCTVAFKGEQESCWGHKGSLGVKGHSIRGLLEIKGSLGVEVCSVKHFVLCFPKRLEHLHTHTPLFHAIRHHIQSGPLHICTSQRVAPDFSRMHAAAMSFAPTIPPCPAEDHCLLCAAQHRAAHTVPMSAPLTHCIHPPLASAAPFICTARSPFQRFTN